MENNVIKCFTLPLLSATHNFMALVKIQIGHTRIRPMIKDCHSNGIHFESESHCLYVIVCAPAAVHVCVCIAYCSTCTQFVWMVEHVH